LLHYTNMRPLLFVSLLSTTALAFVPRSTVQKSFVAVSPTTTATSLHSTPVVSTTEYELLSLPARNGRPLKVAIAGGGVGGLTTALCLLKKGIDVTVYEKTAAFARFGGPIQFASNALSVLKEVDDTLFERVMDKFTFTGTRTCGIKDGLRADGSFRMTDDSLDYLWNPDAPADWFVKFPLKVRPICGACLYLECQAGSHIVLHVHIYFHFFSTIAMRRPLWSAIHRSD
jgi:NAD(P)-binding Rossmann-like domain